MKIYSTHRNNYDECLITSHPDDPNYRILSCKNYMNEQDKHFLYDNQFAMCNNHYCAITFDVTDLTHKILTCSGSIFKFDKEKFFNPLNIYKPSFDELLPLPSDVFATEFENYYLKDSRTAFSDNLVSVNCSNDYSTCLEFENGESFCMGNAKDIFIINSFPSFIIGIMISLLFVTFIFLSLRQYIRYFRNIVMIFMYAVPLISIALIFNSLFAMSFVSYAIGNIIIVVGVPITVNYVDSFFTGLTFQSDDQKG